VAAPAAGTYKAGDRLDFTVNFSDVVTVNITGGTPAIGLTVGATPRNASYLSGIGTTALVFRYTVPGGDTDTDGIALASAISLNGGTIKGAVGNDATLTFTPPDTSAVLVDTTAPTAAISYSPAGPYKKGDAVTITANFSEAMAAAPAPKIALSGAATLAATAMTLTDTTHYYYTYTTGSGDGTVNAALSVGTDLAGNVVTATPTSGGSFTLDNTAPTVALSYAPTGPYKSGAAVTITATFSEAMAAAPAPKIALSGAATLAATAMTLTDSTHYTYSYTAGSGDGTVTVALSVGTDLAGNAITATPTSGGSFTLAAAPTVTARQGSCSGLPSALRPAVLSFRASSPSSFSRS